MYWGCSYFNKISLFIKESEKKGVLCTALPIPSGKSSESIFSAIWRLTSLGCLFHLIFDKQFPNHLLLTASFYFCNWFLERNFNYMWWFSFGCFLFLARRISYILPVSLGCSFCAFNGISITYIYKEKCRFNYMVWHAALQFSPLFIFATLESTNWQILGPGDSQPPFHPDEIGWSKSISFLIDLGCFKAKFS